MQLEHSFTVPVGIDEAWRILLDIERIGPCMPGASIESVDGDDFTGSVKVKLGPINLTYKGKASFVEKDEVARRAVIDARGRDARGNGTAAAKVTATLHEADGSTSVKVATDLDITGKPAQFGRGVMVDVGNKLIGQFADCLARTISGAEPPAAPAKAAKAAKAPAKKTAAAAKKSSAATKKAADPAPAPPTEPAAEPAMSPPPPATPDPPAEPVAPAAENAAAADPAADATPAYSAPGGIPAADPGTVGTVNGHSASSSSAPRGEVEPIDLLQSAGPAVAKRLAPVAVAAVVVLIAARRYRARHND